MQRANGKYKDHLVGQLTRGGPDPFIVKDYENGPFFLQPSLIIIIISDQLHSHRTLSLSWRAEATRMPSHPNNIVSEIINVFVFVFVFLCAYYGRNPLCY